MICPMKKLILIVVAMVALAGCYKVCLNGAGDDDECGGLTVDAGINAGRDGGARD